MSSAKHELSVHRRQSQDDFVFNSMNLHDVLKLAASLTPPCFVCIPGCLVCCTGDKQLCFLDTALFVEAWNDEHHECHVPVLCLTLALIQAYKVLTSNSFDVSSDSRQMNKAQCNSCNA